MAEMHDFSDLSKMTYELSATMESGVLELLWGDPLPVEEPTFSMEYHSVVSPVVTPVKRRGLTGKAYRIARRHYHRQTRAYARGLIPGVKIVHVLPNVRIIDTQRIPGDPNGVSIQFGVVDPIRSWQHDV